MKFDYFAVTSIAMLTYRRAIRVQLIFRAIPGLFVFESSCLGINMDKPHLHTVIDHFMHLQVGVCVQFATK